MPGDDGGGDHPVGVVLAQGQLVGCGAAAADEVHPVQPQVVEHLGEVVGVLAEARPGSRLEAPNPGRSVVTTRSPRSAQGVRSARTDQRHPGVPGTRSTGMPSASPQSVQATVRPSRTLIEASRGSVAASIGPRSQSRRRCGDHPSRLGAAPHGAAPGPGTADLAC